MASPVKPAEIFEKAADEGKRRLGQGFAGNVIGGFGLVTLPHAAQALGEKNS